MSRIAIGFSPTIYASDIRTNTVMCFCLIAVAIYIFSINMDLLESQPNENEKVIVNKKNIINAAIILAIFSAINLVYAIYNTFL